MISYLRIFLFLILQTYVHCLFITGDEFDLLAEWSGKLYIETGGIYSPVCARNADDSGEAPTCIISDGGVGQVGISYNTTRNALEGLGVFDSEYFIATKLQKVVNFGNGDEITNAKISKIIIHAENLYSSPNFHLCPYSDTLAFYEVGLGTEDEGVAALQAAVNTIPSIAANAVIVPFLLNSLDVMYIDIDATKTTGALDTTFLITKCKIVPESKYITPAGRYREECKNPITNCNEIITRTTPGDTDYCTYNGVDEFGYCRHPLLDANLDHLENCTAGFYCTGSAQRIKCPAGYFCPASTPLSSLTNHSSLRCPLGSYCPLGSSEPSACLSGDYCPVGSIRRTLCPVGYYCPTPSTIFECTGDAICAQGSIAEGICNEHGSTGVITEGLCECYSFFTGAACETLTLFNSSIRYNVRALSDTTIGTCVDLTANPFDNCATTPNVDVVADTTTCPDDLFDYPASIDFSYRVDGCCFKVSGGVQGSLSNEEFVCGSEFTWGGDDYTLNVTELDFDTEYFVGMSYDDSSTVHHYCCNRYSGVNSIGKLLNYETRTFKFENLLGMKYYDQFENDFGVIALKHFYSAVYLLSQKNYFYAQIGFSYVFDIMSKLTDTQGTRVFLDLDDIITRSINIIESALYSGVEFIDKRLPTDYKVAFGDTRDLRPEFSVLLVRFFYLQELRLNMTDTLALTLTPLSEDFDTFISVNVEPTILDRCKFASDGNVSFPQCDSFAASDTQRLETAVAIARCAVVPHTIDSSTYASNIIAPQTYIGQAFHCVRQVKKLESNKDIYLQALLVLSTIADQTEFLYDTQDNKDLQYTRSLIKKDYVDFRTAISDKKDITSIRDNTADYYTTTLANIEARFTLNEIRYRIDEQTSQIQQSLDSQTAELSSVITSNSYDLFQYLNNTFGVVFDNFHAGIDYEETSLDATISGLNSTIVDGLERLTADIETFRSYVEIFQSRLEEMLEVSISRIDFLYDKEIAEADLRLANAQLNFIASIFIEIASFALAFIPGVGPALSFALGIASIEIGNQIVKEEPRGTPYTGENLRRVLQESTLGDEIEAYVDSFENFTYSETSIELFASFGETAKIIVNRTLAECVEFRVDPNVTSVVSREEDCIDVFDSILYTLLQESVTRDYMYGCTTPEGFDDIIGLSEKNRFLIKDEEIGSSVSQALFTIFGAANKETVIEIYKGIIYEIDVEFGCNDDFFGEYDSSLPINNVSYTPAEEAKYSRGFDTSGVLGFGSATYALSYYGSGPLNMDDTLARRFTKLRFKLSGAGPAKIVPSSWTSVLDKLDTEAAKIIAGDATDGFNNFLNRVFRQHGEYDEALADIAVDHVIEKLAEETDSGSVRSLVEDGFISKADAEPLYRSRVNTEDITDLLSEQEIDDFLAILDNDIDKLDDLVAADLIDMFDNPTKVDALADILDTKATPGEFFDNILEPNQANTVFKSPAGHVDELVDLADAGTIRGKFDTIPGFVNDVDEVLSAQHVRGSKVIKKYTKLLERVPNAMNNFANQLRADIGDIAEHVFENVKTVKVPGLSKLKGAGRFLKGVAGTSKIAATGSKLASKVAPIAKVVGEALGPVMSIVGLGMGIAGMVSAGNNHKAEYAAAEATQNSRYNIIFSLFSEIEGHFGVILEEFQKQNVQLQFLNYGVECDEVFSSSYCSNFTLSTAGLWDDIAFRLIDFVQSGSGLCPHTVDFDVFENENFRRVLSTQSAALSSALDERSLSETRPSRFLEAIADKIAAEAAIAEAKENYNRETELMHQKLCPDFIAIVRQLTSYGKNIQNGVFQTLEQVREMIALTTKKQANERRKKGLTENIEMNRDFAQAFLQKKIDDIDDIYSDTEFEVTAKSLARATISVNERIDQIADVNEFNKIYRESCELASYLKHFDNAYDDCEVDVVYDNPSDTRAALLDSATYSRSVLENLYSSSIYGGGNYITNEEFELDVTSKIDFNSSGFLDGKFFTFDILPPPDVAYWNRNPTPEYPSTFAKPWISNHESIFLYDIQFIFRNPADDSIIQTEDVDTKSMACDVFLGPVFTQIWSDSNTETIYRKEFMFNLQGGGNTIAPVNDGKIKIFASYYPSTTTGSLVTKFSDNLVTDSLASNNPGVPLPSVYTSYNVSLAFKTHAVLKEYLDNGVVPDVSLLINFYSRGNTFIRGPVTITPAPTRVPTTTGQTDSPTVTPEIARTGLGAFHDVIYECDTDWTYDSGDGSSVQTPDSDGCMSVSSSLTKPFRGTKLDEQTFPPDDVDVVSATPIGYELNAERWCSIRRNLCGSGINRVYDPQSGDTNSECTSGEVRRAWVYCLYEIEPTVAPTAQPSTGVPTTGVPTDVPTTPAPTTLAPTISYVTEALGGFLDPENTAAYPMECDDGWSYKETSGATEVFPEADNCLPLSGDTLPKNPSTPDYAADSTEVIAAIPVGFEIDETRWCSVRFNNCGGFGLLYRPDATGDEGTCTQNQKQKSWGYCLRPITPTATPTSAAPTTSTNAPTDSPTVYETTAVGGFIDPEDEGVPIVCDDSWTYKEQSSDSAISPDVDNCLPIETGTFPFRHFTETISSDVAHDFLAASTLVQAAVPEGYQLDATRWCSIKKSKCQTTNGLYRLDAVNADSDCTVGQILRAWGFCITPIVPTPAPTTVPPTPSPTQGARTGTAAYFDFAEVGLIDCDASWSYYDHTSDLTGVPDADNCMDIDAFPPFDVAGIDYSPYLIADSQLSNNLTMSFSRWCAVTVNQCDKGNDVYNPATEGETDECTTGKLRRAWVYCALDRADVPEQTLPPTPPPSPAPTLRYPLAIGGFRNPVFGAIECDTPSSYRLNNNDDNVIDALEADNYTFSLDLEGNTVPFFKDGGLVDYAHEDIDASQIPAGHYVSSTRWCSYKSAGYQGGNGGCAGNTIYTLSPNENANSPCSVGEQKRVWGYALLPGTDPDLYAPTRAPTTTPPSTAPTSLGDVLPRAVLGYVAPGESTGGVIGVPCDENWFYRADDTGASLISANSDGCLPLLSGTLPFRHDESDFTLEEYLESIDLPADTVLEEARWCSITQRLYSTSNPYYTADPTSNRGFNPTTGNQATVGEQKRAWGFCLRSGIEATAEPSPYPTSFPSNPGDTVAPSTEPTTIAPTITTTTDTPTTLAPTTDTPTSDTPTTLSPTTAAPTTLSPSRAPNTVAPTEDPNQLMSTLTLVGAIALAIIVVVVLMFFFTGGGATSASFTPVRSEFSTIRDEDLNLDNIF